MTDCLTAQSVQQLWYRFAQCAHSQMALTMAIQMHYFYTRQGMRICLSLLSPKALVTNPLHAIQLDDMTVIYCHGQETLCSPFLYELKVAIPSPTLENDDKSGFISSIYDKFLGQCAHLTITDRSNQKDKSEKTLVGIITSVHINQHAIEATIVLEHSLSLLRYERTYRVYQNVDTLTIVEDILQKHQLQPEHDYIIRTSGTYHPWPLKLQINQNTLHFLYAVMARCGLFYAYVPNYTKYNETTKTLILFITDDIKLLAQHT